MCRSDTHTHCSDELLEHSSHFQGSAVISLIENKVENPPSSLFTTLPFQHFVLSLRRSLIALNAPSTDTLRTSISPISGPQLMPTLRWPLLSLFSVTIFLTVLLNHQDFNLCCSMHTLSTAPSRFLAAKRLGGGLLDIYYRSGMERNQLKNFLMPPSLVILG